MKVKDLIGTLSTMPQDYDVKLKIKTEDGSPACTPVFYDVPSRWATTMARDVTVDNYSKKVELS